MKTRFYFNRLSATSPPAFRVRAGWLFLILLGIGMPALSAPPAPMAEHEIKALYLFNFAKYVDWPEPALGATNAPFSIGIKGAPDIVRNLKEITRGKLLKNRPVQIVAIQEGEGIGGCQMIFIESTDASGVIHALTTPFPKPVLTVGHCESFLDQGGIINFFKEENTLHMEINLENAHQAGLTVSAKLLAVGRVKRKQSILAAP